MKKKCEMRDSLFWNPCAKLVLIMKFTSFFLLCFALNLSAAVYSQQTRLKVDFNQATIKNVMADIENKTGLTFFYSGDALDIEKTVTLYSENMSLGDILLLIKDQTGLSFEIVRDQILVRKTGVSDSEMGQNHISVSGVVTDSSGAPLPGVTVRIKGTTMGTVTNSEGVFSFSQVSPDVILQFTFIGMKSKEMALNGKTQINITMTEDYFGIDEVIAVGYGTMKKSDINASIVSIDSEDLVKSSTPNVSEMLMGKAAGLTVMQNSAQPGGGVSVLIRGAASTGAGNEPLYVIDGFPVVNSGVEPGSGNQWYGGSRNPLNDINPNDIESIEILKDASATAIYGARGSNGVILITTKRGSKGTNIEYNFNTSVQVIDKKPEILNGQEFMVEQNRYLKEYYLLQNKLAPYGNTNPSDVSPYVPKYSEEEIAMQGTGTNWYDLVTQSGKINQHNLTINHGNEVSRSLLSLNFFDQEGVVKTSGIQRFSIRYNLDHKISTWWNYGVSSIATMVKERNATLGDGRDATAGIIESALNYSPLIQAQRNPLTGAWIEDPNQALLNHPLSYLDITDKTKTKRFLTTLFTNIYIRPELWVKLSSGIDIRDGIRQNYYPKTTRYGSQVGGDANINSAYREDYLTDIVLNYQKQLSLKHKLLILAGYSYQNQNDDGVYARAMNFSSDALLYYALQAGEEKPIVSSYRNKHILVSYFSRLQYSFADKYLFTFTGRVDGSDRFGENNRYAFFPSGAFAWRAVEEDFLKDSPLVSDLKLRLSAGQVGNENIANDAASEYYAFQGRNYYFDGVEKRGVNVAKMPNPNLKWETTTEYNLGIDFGFFKNRISGNADFFYKQIKDLLSYRALPHTSIVSSVPWNVGKTQSKGFEFTLNTVNLKGPVHWTSTWTYTSYRDQWLERDPKVILQPYQTSTDPLTAVFALIPDGIKQVGESTPAQPNLMPGQQKYKDINGLDSEGKLTGNPDGIINQADVVFKGIRAPKFTLGFNNTFKYKGLDLNCFVYASVGGLKWPTTRMEHGVYGSYGVQRLKDNYNFLKEIQDRWTSDNTSATMPSGEVNSYDGYGSPYWENSSYIRLKNLSLGYDISNWVARKQNYTARVYINAQNLLTYTGYNGLDPEIENDRAAYPQQKTFSLGIDFKF